MARVKNILYAVLFCVLNAKTLNGRIYARNMDSFRIFQQPDISSQGPEISVNRFRRDLNETSKEHADLIHSQNSTLSTKAFAIHGATDNEAFVHWTGENNDTVFVLTRSHRTGSIQTSALWRSTNYGETYTRVALPDMFRVNHMYSSPASRTKTILCDLGASRLYISEDTGATWKDVQLTFNPYRILLHPTHPDLVLAYSLQQMKLYVSEDFGATWRLMKERVTERFFWAVPGVDLDPNTVHMELQDPIGPVSYFACTAPSCVKVPVDTSIGTIDFYSLIVENNYIFVQKSVDDITSLYVSYKRGPFKKAFFPQDLHPLDFNIVDTNDNQVFIVVDHEEDKANLYLSDVTGQFYVTSMENVVGLRYPGKFDVDLVKVKGLKGIYIVNKFEMPRSSGGAFAQKTYITSDKGGSWKTLNAPDVHKQRCDSDDSCHLHLHIGNTNQFFRIPLAISKEEAPGLVVAHGSVGEYLDLDTHVYISRDAGLTWTAAPFYGNHFINIMDQGSAISAVLADGHPTNQVHFSCTEGATWVSHNFTDSQMNVDGVINEPGIRTLISSVFGHMNSSDGWVMVKMNFSSVLPRKCEDQDFEMWRPANDVINSVNKCLMGESLVFERRKQLSECYYGRDYFRPKNSTICGCDRVDFECDYGYQLKADGSCVKAPWFDEDLLPPPACVNDKYNKTSGYRKVASSKCQGGKEGKYSYVETDCPLLAPRGLKIIAFKSFIARGVNVTFRLTQESGSEKETVYTWKFRDDLVPVTIKGLDAASSMTTVFLETGSYNVTVTAVNNKGNTSTYLTVYVEDELKGVLVEIPWGVRIGIPSYFNVTVLRSDNSTTQGTDLHFAWQFESKSTGPYRQLTWQNVIQQEFTHPGEYTLILEVFNSVSSIFYTQPVEVYDDATTVRLHFSSQINNYNSSNLNVRQALAEILCHNLAQILEIRRTRIIMTVQPFMPIVGDVTVLPAKPNSNESETYKIVQMLIAEAKEQYLAFPLFTTDDIVVIMDAGILDLRSGDESPTIPPPPKTVTVTVMVPVNVTMVDEKHSLLAVYLSVPVIILVIIVAVCLILYYKKKSVPRHQRYAPIVKHHRVHHDSTCSCGDDDFPINIEEPDDSLIPDTQFEDSNPTLLILNEPRSSNSSGRLARNC